MMNEVSHVSARLGQICHQYHHHLETFFQMCPSSHTQKLARLLQGLWIKACLIAEYFDERSGVYTKAGGKSRDVLYAVSRYATIGNLGFDKRVVPMLTKNIYTCILNQEGEKGTCIYQTYMYQQRGKLHTTHTLSFFHVDQDPSSQMRDHLVCVSCRR